MSQPPQLIYPTIDLFLYDLRDGLGQSSDQIHQNRRRFWQRIYNDSLNEQKLEQLQATEETFSSYIELLDTQRIERFKYPLDGYYYPVKLGDTYAVQIDCSGKENDPDWEQLSQPEQLQQLKTIVLDRTHNISGEMGANWLIWGKLATPNQDPEITAKDCYSALEIVANPNWQRDCKGRGTFQGARLFELERPDIKPDGYNRNHHILICLFPHDKTDDEIKEIIGKLYRNLIRLFHYRNKVLWVYEQSRQLHDTLKKSSSIVQKLVDSLPDRITPAPLNLQQLQQDLATALSISHNYETNLGYLQEQATTLEVNATNYQRRTETIAQLDPNGDLAFLERFGEYATEKCLSHIQTDYQALSAGLKPLENFIKTIGGIIEIERTKNERTLNQTVAIASVGISTAALAASTFTDPAEGIVERLLPTPANQPTPIRNHLLSFALAFFLSLIVGAIAAAITKYALSAGKKR
jgi:hypothetical protein